MDTKFGFLTVKGLEDMFIPMLRNCKSTGFMKKIHAQMVKFSLSQSNYLVTKMVEICDKLGEVDYASLLFKQVEEPNNYLYNCMIRAYTNRQRYVPCINIYKQMMEQTESEETTSPDEYTYPFVIRSCGGLLCVNLGKQFHGQVSKFGFKSSSMIENSLLDMYVKCDQMSYAHKLFEEMSERDVISWNSLISGHIKLRQVRKARALFEEMPNKTVVSWTAMISGYTKTGCYGDALDVFRRMQMIGMKPDWISLVAVLPACAQLGALELGKWIHFYAEKYGYLRKTSVCNALMEMYAKCGSVNQAWQLFNEMSERDVISWSTMIGGLANHGRAHEALKLFNEMQRSAVEPNEITFVGLLCACAHAGLVNDGLRYFNSMKNNYNIEPRIEHYGCLVDLLGRTGRLELALARIKSMPVKPDSAIWGSLLSSCRTHRNLEMAVIAMEHLLELEPEDTGNYILLANIYADLGKWDGVSRMRKLIRSKSMKKTPGCSLIEVNSVVQEFLSGDDSKPFSKDIHQVLELLALHQSKENDLVDITLEYLSP
ncbi:pentatricopeptide repeat-containing protein At2g20540-like [Nicotiana tabacum]|uniref:Pentatricopeptide repeat-containing protein At2g20540-like n=5 Tax=Nicotiana TaxID=4085 RepID=A0A1S4D3S6_TOBAC|nr:PREDICTED: pentatricopeptide repeat-containing protein At2g20540 [Nicotiana sylvestris]XP_009766198.1 PREDICTED: pentatricopeptide repeat-containing protein At2g20540 [Nicotiana sylvestris]XP_009766199.1 PREDICTED: pentatricopeptide repeat-containing protein At2g20540 [Nicotiana sylvestris]XP_009766200.1 PREDICTED: pentatricopeptide repeat-containing protein At2g20540 [Nicotiana sylvestris]XP_016507926.1 PREDICTED: pentatricopeptide repeat-containing protein At2g20540-like [Nicotiana tabacum